MGMFLSAGPLQALWPGEIGAISAFPSGRKSPALPSLRQRQTYGNNQPVRRRMALLGPAIALALAGCQSAGGISPDVGTATALPTDFNPVVTDPLAPADGVTDPNADPNAPPASPLQVVDPLAEPDAIGQPDQTAMLAANTDITIAVDDLRGSWTIIINGAACQLSMTSTPWENGFRGSTRDCPSDALSSVSSWNVVDQQVVLYAAGAEVSRLYAVSLVRNGDVVENARFEGQMVAGGTTIAFFR